MKTFKKLYLALLITIAYTGVSPVIAHASGGFTSVTLDVAGKCHKALDRRTPIESGARCTLGVYYFDSDIVSASALEGITYWVESRKNTKSPWKRFLKEHIFNANGSIERVSFLTNGTAQYRVVFDTYGQHAFPEYTTDSVTIYSKGK